MRATGQIGATLHAEVLDWLKSVRPLVGRRDLVCEFGSMNVNGSPREVFERQTASYLGLDVREGPGVDRVANAAWWNPDILFDLIISTETLEHTPYAAAICYNAYRLLRPGGIFLVTAAGPKRTPHSIDGDLDLGGEFYKNVVEADLREWLSPFSVVLTQNRDGLDLYALAVKGDE